MSDQGFDIASLMNFSPAKYLCEKCLALWVDTPDWTTSEVACPVCHVKYIPTDEFRQYAVGEYLKSNSLSIEFADLIGHSRTLASIATRTRNFLSLPTGSPGRTLNPYEPMRALFDALLNAKQFVHFVTFGCSPVLMGAIKMAAQRVPVRGIISNAQDSTKEEFVTHKDEAPKLSVRIFERSDRREDWQVAPHQKLIVVDGLLLFKGAANLTTDGWRKAARGLDVIEVETNVKEIIRFHNTYFSPVWTGFTSAQEIQMLNDLPF